VYQESTAFVGHWELQLSRFMEAVGAGAPRSSAVVSSFGEWLPDEQTAMQSIPSRVRDEGVLITVLHSLPADLLPTLTPTPMRSLVGPGVAGPSAAVRPIPSPVTACAVQPGDHRMGLRVRPAHLGWRLQRRVRVACVHPQSHPQLAGGLWHGAGRRGGLVRGCCPCFFFCRLPVTRVPYLLPVVRV